MIRIEGNRITIGDDLFGSNYYHGHTDFDVTLASGEEVRIPFRVLRFALSTLAYTHECASFEELWREIGGGTFTWHGERERGCECARDARREIGEDCDD